MTPPPLKDGLLLVSMPKGIYKPSDLPYAVSIRINLNSPYGDGVPVPTPGGSWLLSYHQENADPAARDTMFTNRGLMRCIADQVPVGVLRERIHAGRDHQYDVLGLAMPVRWSDGRFFFESLRSSRPSRVVDRINELIHDLVSEPELLFDVDSREFECLIAEILRRRGYDVQVTRQSRDGGVDIYASRIECSGLHGLYFVQCKRHSRQNKVGVRPVRELYGIVCARNATGGIVITTSFFTSPAIEFQSTIPNRMALQDNSDVLRWLRETAPSWPMSRGRIPVLSGHLRLCRACVPTQSPVEGAPVAPLLIQEWRNSAQITSRAQRARWMCRRTRTFRRCTS